MADGHVGYVMPIGGVAAYRDKVSVVGVGFDIACGNAAIRTDLDARATSPDVRESSRSSARRRDPGPGQLRHRPQEPRRRCAGRSPAVRRRRRGTRCRRKQREALREKARAQLGTVGSGNHYVDVFADETGAIWVGVHFGSRGFGHTVASGFLALGQGEVVGRARAGARSAARRSTRRSATTTGSSWSSPGEYAYAGREWVARKVVAILGGSELELVHNHHNFAWREDARRRGVIVVRKGATPAFPGQHGFIGGSMGDDAVIVAGHAARARGRSHASVRSATRCTRPCTAPAA